MKYGLIDPVKVVDQWFNRWASNWSRLTRYILKNSKLYISIIYKYITNIIWLRKIHSYSKIQNSNGSIKVDEDFLSSCSHLSYSCLSVMVGQGINNDEEELFASSYLLLMTLLWYYISSVKMSKLCTIIYHQPLEENAKLENGSWERKAWEKFLLFSEWRRDYQT